MPESQPFGIVWKPFVNRSPTGRVLEHEAAYPYLLAGASLAAMNAGQAIRLDPRALVGGILVASGDTPAYVEAASERQLTDALEDLVHMHRAPALEVLLLDAAASLHAQHGRHVAQGALRTALRIIPESAMILSDLLMAIYEGLRSADERERAALLEEIAEGFPRLKLNLIDPDAAETLVYAELVALSLLGRLEERDRLARSVAPQYIRRAGVVSRVRHLLSEPIPDLEVIL